MDKIVLSKNDILAILDLLKHSIDKLDIMGIDNVLGLVSRIIASSDDEDSHFYLFEDAEFALNKRKDAIRKLLKETDGGLPW